MSAIMSLVLQPLLRLLPVRNAVSGAERSHSRAATPPCACWARDPLSHPDIARMSERERGDLPFDSSAFRP